MKQVLDFNNFLNEEEIDLTDDIQTDLYSEGGFNEFEDESLDESEEYEEEYDGYEEEYDSYTAEIDEEDDYFEKEEENIEEEESEEIDEYDGDNYQDFDDEF